MTVVLKDENNLTLCFRQENQYPVPFVCNRVDVLPWNISCKKIFEYHKNLYTPTFTTQTPFIPTTTTTPISSTMTEKVTTEDNGHETDQWKVATFALGIFAFVFAMLFGAAICYIVLSIKPKVSTMNEYGDTPKAPERKSLTGTMQK
uniref:Uncharacterized protein n=1 Tax=Panagrolaimus sp. PS1159 TaxID=55785 RepID=A0AC35GQL9_9BILA